MSPRFPDFTEKNIKKLNPILVNLPFGHPVNVGLLQIFSRFSDLFKHGECEAFRKAASNLCFDIRVITADDHCVWVYTYCSRSVQVIAASPMALSVLCDVDNVN